MGSKLIAAGLTFDTAAPPSQGEEQEKAPVFCSFAGEEQEKAPVFCSFAGEEQENALM